MQLTMTNDDSDEGGIVTGCELSREEWSRERRIPRDEGRSSQKSERR